MMARLKLSLLYIHILALAQHAYSEPLNLRKVLQGWANTSWMQVRRLQDVSDIALAFPESGLCYEGCFHAPVSDPWAAPLPEELARGTFETPMPLLNCSSLALTAGLKYFAIVDEFDCYGGNTTVQGWRQDVDCELQCMPGGNMPYTCGGNRRASVFSFGKCETDTSPCVPSPQLPPRQSSPPRRPVMFSLPQLPQVPQLPPSPGHAISRRSENYRSADADFVKYALQNTAGREPKLPCRWLIAHRHRRHRHVYYLPQTPVAQVLPPTPFTPLHQITSLRIIPPFVAPRNFRCRNDGVALWGVEGPPVKLSLKNNRTVNAEGCLRRCFSDPACSGCYYKTDNNCHQFSQLTRAVEILAYADEYHSCIQPAPLCRGDTDDSHS
ncbi:hypothetical protein VOLCADRAFT_104930 [Volvox carteri f. nagariensis]|uniref:Apple domain-containing protein n=1 Tax=Volvox carteri f. nagariensis TaxID=3068 RepID=D8TX62_VOLCA|nr:uncharacterized protein VOLCADRAFT_104930 [Volvox carteri f. nagariensis]EFJ47955.1 hypothetical protein VOLCADRAFT_104930 [Volvox carteri f. nagariensis]|eukprot:XP_002951061.1 hypothetical protein VOLCADRAFT_104930 [Volvox carteri f. nagariensis]